MDTIIVNITDTNDVITINVTDIPEQITVNLSECISHIYVDGVTITGDGSYSNPLVASGSGDMLASVYDPTGINADSFDYNNFYNTPIIPDAQVNSDWNATSGVSEILNKPTIPTNTSDLTNDGADGVNPFITAQDIPSPVPQVQSDWNQSNNTQPDYIKNKPTMPTQATEIVAGIAEIATQTETNTGTDDQRIITPFKLAGWWTNIKTLAQSITGYWSYINGLFADFIQFNTAPNNVGGGVGKMIWNDTDGTLDLGLKGGNVTLQIGQEQVVRVVNKTSPLIDLLESDYQAVKVYNATGQRLSVRLAKADSDLNSATTLGVVTENIPKNQEGFITTVGRVNEINTTGSIQGETWADGDILYLSPTVEGGLTNVKPIAPAHSIIIGYVEYAHAVHGKIFVKVDNGYELEELHDVSVSPYINGGVLYRDTATNLWKHNTISNVLGYTPVPTTRTLTINGTSLDLSANRTWTISGAAALSAITAAAANNTISNTSYNQIWQWTNQTGSGLKLSNTSSTPVNNSVLLELESSGAPSTTGNFYAQKIIANRTGTNVINYGLDITHVGVNGSGLNIATGGTAINIASGATNGLSLNGSRILTDANTSIQYTGGTLNINSANSRTYFTTTGTSNYWAFNSSASANFLTINRIGNGNYAIVFNGDYFNGNYRSELTSTNVIKANGGSLTFTGNTGLAGSFGSYTPTDIMTVYGTNSNVGIGTTTPNSSSALEISSTTKGLLLPRMTTTQRNAISTPTAGLVIFNTTTIKMEVYDGTTWQQAW